MYILCVVRDKPKRDLCEIEEDKERRCKEAAPTFGIMSWFILGVVLLAGGVPVVAEFAGGCVMLRAVCRSMEVRGAARRPRWLRRHGEEAAQDLRSGNFNDTQRHGCMEMLRCG